MGDDPMDLKAQLEQSEELVAKFYKEIMTAFDILDPENRFESLEDAAKARMQQIIALEALR